MNDQSPKLSHHNCRHLEYYYESLEIEAKTSGYYMFSHDDDLDIYGYLYEYSFDPYSSMDTSFARSDMDCKKSQFKITAYLQSNITYILVITTKYDAVNIKGPFSLIVSGLDETNINRIGIYWTYRHFLLRTEYFLYFKLIFQQQK